MPLDKPFHRNYRQIIQKPNSSYSDWAYIIDKDYAISPEHFTRAFIIIQNDMKKLFEFIEPSDKNLETYSYRIHELFIRTCIEVEANFKAILKENIYNPINKKGESRTENEWKLSDYRKINTTHHLDEYVVKIPIWTGSKYIYKPFDDWKTKPNLSWYSAYNESKHDRHINFHKANFENLLYSITGLFVLLSSQFRAECFSPGNNTIGFSSDCYYSGSFGLGDFFIIEFPDNWTDDEKYDFDWSILKDEKNKFNKINYDKIHTTAPNKG